MRIMFKIKTWYYLELLTPETTKLLGSTKNKITKDENEESMPHLEITDLVLHYVKSVEIRSYFWSIFPCIRIEYGYLRIQENRTINNSVFGHFLCSINTLWYC